MSESDAETHGPSSPETALGKAMFEELLWVHSVIRRDLESVEQLAADVSDGLTGEAVRGRLQDLKTNADLLDVIEVSARALNEADGDDARQRVMEGLQNLHGHLLEHLEYEERNAGPTIRRLHHLVY